MVIADAAWGLSDFWQTILGLALCGMLGLAVYGVKRLNRSLEEMRAPPRMSALPVMEVLLGGLLGVAAAAAVQAASNRDRAVPEAASSRDSAVQQAASSRDRAVEHLLEFFQLQGHKDLREDIVENKQRRGELALVGDIALKYFVVKKLVACKVGTTKDIHNKTQTYIRNERLALLRDKFASCGSRHGCIASAKGVKALLGAGELYLGGRHTQGVVVQIMDYLDTRQ